MTEAPERPVRPTPPVAPTRSPEQAEKAARLAAALRDNLRRRKLAHKAPAKPGN